MEDKNIIHDNAGCSDEQVHIPKNTKQQTIVYTIISIALFFLIYFGGNGLIEMVNRPYLMLQNADGLTNEHIELQYEYAHISKEYGLIYENSRLEKNDSDYKVSILFSGIDDIEAFSENGILFEYGNPILEFEDEFYPYNDNYNMSEYIIAIKYVDNDEPNNEILVFEYDGEIYAEFQSYGSIIPTEVKILFDGCEKIY